MFIIVYGYLIKKISIFSGLTYSTIPTRTNEWRVLEKIQTEGNLNSTGINKLQENCSIPATFTFSILSIIIRQNIFYMCVCAVQK